MSKNKELIPILEKHGFIGHPEQKWVGKPGVDRRQIDVKDRYSCLKFGFTADEWCALCMSDGNSYVGGCCDVCSRIQNAINQIFRLDGGHLRSDEALELIERMRAHEGFELAYADFDQLKEMVEQWDKLSAQGKLCVTLGVFRPYFTPGTNLMPKEGLGKTGPIDALHNASWLVPMMGLSLFNDSTSKKTGQKEGNDEIYLGRLLFAMKESAKILPTLSQPFKGFAIMLDNKVMMNGLGHCLYNNKEDAEEVISIWKEQDEERRAGCKSTFEKLKRMEIVPIEFDYTDSDVQELLVL